MSGSADHATEATVEGAQIILQGMTRQEPENIPRLDTLLGPQ